MDERCGHLGGAGAPWQPSEIRRWLSNRVYLGEVRYGELVNTEAHEPLTDPETWERCRKGAGSAASRPLASSCSPAWFAVRIAATAMGGFTYGGVGDTPRLPLLPGP